MTSEEMTSVCNKLTEILSRMLGLKVCHLQSQADRRGRSFSLSSRRLARFGRPPTVPSSTRRLSHISHTGDAVVRLGEAERQVTDLAYRPQADMLSGESVGNAGYSFRRRPVNEGGRVIEWRRGMAIARSVPSRWSDDANELPMMAFRS
jgi:hypothetical protein